jgi:hypothetical protein
MFQILPQKLFGTSAKINLPGFASLPSPDENFTRGLIKILKIYIQEFTYPGASIQEA